jgi:pilus assembly protein CpaE
VDAWILAGSNNVAACVGNSLRRLAINCPPTHILSPDLVGTSAGLAAGFDGLLLFAVSDIEPGHIEDIRRIRATVGGEAKLAIVSNVAPDHGKVLNAIRAGASDYLWAGDELDNEIASFVARVHSDRNQKDSRGRVITVVPCQSPNDANLLAVNLAVIFAKRLTRCGLLDFHFRGGDLAMLLKLSPRHTLVELLSQTETIDEVMLQQALTTHATGIQLLAGPTSLTDLKNVRVQSCQQIISLAQRFWPVVIINSEDIQHAEQIRAMAASDEVMLTMRLDLVSLHRAQQHIEFLTRNQFARDHVRIVAMGTGYSGELPLAAVKKVLHVSHLTCIPDDPVAVIKSINVGNPLVLEHPTAKPSQAIVKFAESLIGAVAAGSSTAAVRSTAAAKAAAVVALGTLPFFK